jgi:hypothetical protein
VNKKSVFIALSCILIIVLTTQACTTTASPVTQVEPKLSNFPIYKKAKAVPISLADAERLVVDNFGYEFTLFKNSLDLRMSDEEYATIYSDLEEQLINGGWRNQSSMPAEIWGKDTQLFFLSIESLSTGKIDQYRRSYGIKDLEPGQILILTYVIDTSEILPNPTETAKAEEYNRERTEVAISETNEAYEYMQQKTQEAYQYMQQATNEALEREKQSTQMAESATQTAFTSTQQAITQATQTALEEQRQQEAIQATSMALRPILEQMGTQFDESAGLPMNMRVERADPTRWDLTSKPGWLHISGRYQDFSYENYIPKNIFVYPLSHTNISIITRVDGDMYREDQSVSMGLTPNSYETNGYTIKLGITLESDSGRSVYAWACFDDSCSYTSQYEGNFSDQIRFSGPVYLRLDMAGLKYTFYYSENGVDWIYLGRTEGYAAGDKLFLNAGGGSSLYKDDEFDAYYDFLRFEPLITP